MRIGKSFFAFTKAGRKHEGIHESDVKSESLQQTALRPQPRTRNVLSQLIVLTV